MVVSTGHAQLAEFDDARGRNILDQIGDVKNPDLVEAKVRDGDTIINDVGERLFTDPTSGVTLGPNEKSLTLSSVSCKTEIQLSRSMKPHLQVL